MNEESYKPLSINELMKAFNIQKSEKQQIEKILRDLEKDGKIVKTAKDFMDFLTIWVWLQAKYREMRKALAFS